MRFLRQSTNGAKQERCPTSIQAFKHSLIVMLAIMAADAFGGSAMMSSQAGRSEASAGLGFAIVIPAVLILDPRSGKFYSNDARAFVSIGAVGAPRPAMRAGNDDAPVQAGQRPVVAVNAWRNAQEPRVTGARGTAGRLVEGEVICIP